MVFENPPAAFDGVIFAVIRGIGSQANMQLPAVDKVHHALHELRAMAVIFWTIVEIDNERGDLREAFADAVPPVGEAIGETITGDFGEDPVEKDFLQGRHQNATRSTSGRGLKIVIAGGGRHAAFAATCKGADFDDRLRINRNA